MKFIKKFRWINKKILILYFRSWSKITTFHWVRLAGFSRLTSCLQTRPIRIGISTRSMGRSASPGRRTGWSSGWLYGLDTASWLYRIQVIKFFYLTLLKYSVGYLNTCIEIHFVYLICIWGTFKFKYLYLSNICLDKKHSIWTDFQIYIFQIYFFSIFIIPFYVWLSIDSIPQKKIALLLQNSTT